MRTRDLKPDFWTDEKVVQVSDAAKLLFQGLWCLADREGRLEDKPVAIGFKVRPWDPMRADPLLSELAAVGLITRYEAEGKRCILIATLPTHQRLHPREMASKLPPPATSNEKANLGEPRQVIAPGSAGPSGSSGPSGPSEALPSREKPRAGKQASEPDPRHAPMRAALIEVFRRKRGAEYPFDFGREDAEVRRLLKLGLEPTVLAAWERALDSKFPTVSTLVKFRLEFPRFVGRGEGAASAEHRRDAPTKPRPEGKTRL